ncbi:hypothetical protein ISS30_08295 [bacterium]|nr:hypothetical protein [bacterium]
MKSNRKLFIGVFVFALLVWVLDAAVNHFIFYPGRGTFIEHLMIHPDTRHPHMRYILTAGALILGYLFSIFVLRNLKLKKESDGRKNSLDRC